MDFIFQTTQLNDIHYFFNNNNNIHKIKIQFYFTIQQTALLLLVLFYITIVKWWSTSDDKYPQSDKIYYILNKLTMNIKNVSYTKQFNF